MKKLKTVKTPFGRAYDIKGAGDLLVVFVNNGHGREPCRLLLPHQLYVKDVERMLCGPGAAMEVEALLVHSKDFLFVARAK